MAKSNHRAHGEILKLNVVKAFYRLPPLCRLTPVFFSFCILNDFKNVLVIKSVENTEHSSVPSVVSDRLSAQFKLSCSA